MIVSQNIMWVVAVLLVFRFILWSLLRMHMHTLSSLAEDGEAILEEHGSTIGALSEAGVIDRLNDMELFAKEVFAKTIKITPWLLGWRICGWMFSKRIRRAVGTTTLCAENQGGAYFIYGSMVTGILEQPDYFPVSRIRAAYCALLQVKLFVIF